eukprot:180127-Prymnesium_polylepis.2
MASRSTGPHNPFSIDACRANGECYHRRREPGSRRVHLVARGGREAPRVNARSGPTPAHT